MFGAEGLEAASTCCCVRERRDDFRVYRCIYISYMSLLWTYTLSLSLDYSGGSIGIFKEGLGGFRGIRQISRPGFGGLG